HALAHTGSIHILHNLRTGFGCCSCLPEVGVHLGNRRLCLCVGIHRFIAHILDLIPNHSQLVGGFHQGCAFGGLGNLPDVIRSVLGGISHAIQVFNQVLNSLPV